MFCQAQDECFRISGIIISSDSLTAIHNVNIVSELSRYGTTTNNEGRFLIKSETIDTLWVSCVGFERARIPVSKEILSNNELIIKMIRSNVILDSVEIYPFPDYNDFIKNIAKTPSSKQFFVPGISKETDEKYIYKKPTREPPVSPANPVTWIYKTFNKKEVLKRKMNRNRRRFNKEMQRIGADSLMIR